MAEGNGEVSIENKDIKHEPDPYVERTVDYPKLIDYGLDKTVAAKLDEIYKTGKLAHKDLDERALDALRDFPVDGALSVLTQFLDSNLEHVSNKSAYLCGVMKTYRQKSRGGTSSGVSGAVPLAGGNVAKGPDEDKIKAILDRTGYSLDVTTGQRKYGGPPPGWDGPSPGNGCEVFCGKIPKDMFEDELILLFEKYGKIWDLRLMMDPLSGTNRGYAFITYTNKQDAQQATKDLDNHEIKPGKNLKVNISVPNLRLFVGNIPKSKGKEEILDEFGKLTGHEAFTTPRPALIGNFPFTLFLQLNDIEIRKGKKIGVTLSLNNHRIFVGNIPKNRDRNELFEEFSQHAPGLTEVIIYSSPDDKKKNRGFCFLEYESHKAASLAKRRLGTGRIKVWGCDIIVDWADPQEEPDSETMSKVKVLYVRNLTQECSEEKLKEAFEVYGVVERVKKIKDYAFIHFEDRDAAVAAMDALNAKEMFGSSIEVSLAKPPSDKKKKEEILRARERRMMAMMQIRGGGGGGYSPQHPSMMGGGGGGGPPRGAPGGGARGAGNSMRPMGRGDYDYDYDYYGYGDYRGGYSDPYYDDYYRYEDYYYDYAPPPPPARGRGRQAQPDIEEDILDRRASMYDMNFGIQAGRGRGVVARGRAGGPPIRGGPRGGRGVAASGGRGGARPPVRGGLRAKGSLPGEDGKRKFDGGHQNQGETKRRYQSSWGSQPLAQQPLSNAYGMNGGGYSSGSDAQWYTDSYQWS